MPRNGETLKKRMEQYGHSWSSSTKKGEAMTQAREKPPIEPSPREVQEQTPDIIPKHQNESTQIVSVQRQPSVRIQLPPQGQYSSSYAPTYGYK